jgi:hypothetical protein
MRWWVWGFGCGVITSVGRWGFLVGSYCRIVRLWLVRLRRSRINVRVNRHRLFSEHIERALKSWPFASIF